MSAAIKKYFPGVYAIERDAKRRFISSQSFSVFYKSLTDINKH